MRVVLWATPASKPAMEKRFGRVKGLDLVSVDSADAVIAALPQAEVLALQVFNYTPAVAQAVREGHAPKLRLIQILTVGYDRLQKEKIPPQIMVATAGDSLGTVVAEHAIGLTLALLRRTPEMLAMQARRHWGNDVMGRMGSLDGRTVAVVGFGAIGREIGRLSQAFGARSIGLSRSATPHPSGDEVRSMTRLDETLAEADVVAVATPLTDETRGLFDAERFARMKRGALFINIARGPVVVTEALIAALESGHLAGAGLDVADPEPPPPDHPLWTAPNLILTPHCAVAGGAYRLAEFVGDNLERIMRGEQPHSVVAL